MTFSISARVSSRDPYINTRSWNDSRDDIEKVIYINLFIIYFRQIVLWGKYKYEIIKWLYMEV
jgi:hypothetical protein